MQERVTTYDNHRIVILTPDNIVEEWYLKNEQMLKIMDDFRVNPGEMVTSSPFCKRLKNPNPEVVPIVMRTSKFYRTYEMVKSIEDIH
jgi:hypothetical protein